MRQSNLRYFVALLAIALLSGCAANASSSPNSPSSTSGTPSATPTVINDYTFPAAKPGCERKGQEPPLSCGVEIKQGEAKEISPGVTVTLGAPVALVPGPDLASDPADKLVRIPITIVNSSSENFSIDGMDPMKLEGGTYSHMSLDLTNNVLMPVDLKSPNLTPDTFDLRPGATLEYNIGFNTSGTEFDVLLFDRYSRLSLTSHVIVPQA